MAVELQAVAKTQMDPITIHVVHAFSDDHKSGNLAGVCLLKTADELDAKTMQAIAAELRYPETAFVTHLNDNSYSVRWFTPTTEVDLCGHGALATAFVLFQSSSLKEVQLETKSGILICRQTEDKIQIDFPQFDFCTVDKTRDPWTDFGGLFVGNLPIEEMVFSESSGRLAIVLHPSVTRDELQILVPNFRLTMLRFPGGSVKGVAVTVRNSNPSEGYDFISRYFAPWVGIPEDPVTGSVHCLLTPYWAKRLGKDQLFARQCSKSGGELWLKLTDNNRVEISGKATLREDRVLHYRP